MRERRDPAHLVKASLHEGADRVFIQTLRPGIFRSTSLPANVQPRDAQPAELCRAGRAHRDVGARGGAGSVDGEGQ